jgi:hypothetical protein
MSSKMSSKMYSIAFVFSIFFVSSAVALEGATFDTSRNTLTIPTVNIDNQIFYYLRLSLSAFETEIRFEVEDGREIDPQDYSDAYYSTATSRLSVLNVDLDGSQWLINLDLVRDSSQFIVGSLLSATADTKGNVSKVEYIDNTMSRYIYRFLEEGTIETIENTRAGYRFNDDNTVSIHANYAGYPIYGTHGGDMNTEDVSSAIALSRTFRDWINHHLSETSSGQEDNGTFSNFDIDFPALANALSRHSWVYACASASVTRGFWDSVARACEAPIE